MTDTRDAPTTADGPTSGPSEGVRVLTPTLGTEARQVNVQVLRDWARDLGLADVGAAPVNDTTLQGESLAKTFTERWVHERYHAGLTYMEAPRLSPAQLLPSVKTVLVALAATERVTPEAKNRGTNEGTVAAYARGLDYHHVLKDKLWRLTQRLCDASAMPVTARVCVDTAPVLERYWASAAGVAFVGKSTMAIAPGIGTRVLLGLVLLDQELPSSPLRLDGCGTCTRCLDACPTQAFPAPYVLDANKCISYLTIENSSDIEPNLRSNVGTRVFGCDVCQTVCPYNASRKLPEALSELRSVPQRATADLTSWLALTSGDYRRLTQRSALRRTPRVQLQRNAAVALGNTNSPEAILPLGQALSRNTSPLVRKHAVWALGQLASKDPPRVRQLLCQTRELETDDAVLLEIERVLTAIDTLTTDTSG